MSRLRWAVVKFGLVGAGVVMAAACYALLLTWWRAPLDQATGQRFLWPLFDLEGPVLVGYTLFALALGVFAGAPTRKTLPAVAITLAGFLATRLPVGLLARPRFLAPLERTFPVAGTAAPNQLTGDWMGRAAPAAEARPPRSMSRPSHARRVVMVADQPLDPVGKGGVVADEPIGAVAGAHKGHLVPADLDIRMVACGLGGVVEDAAAQVVSVSSLMVRPSASSPAASGSPRSRSTSRMKMS